MYEVEEIRLLRHVGVLNLEIECLPLETETVYRILDCLWKRFVNHQPRNASADGVLTLTQIACQAALDYLSPRQALVYTIDRTANRGLAFRTHQKID